MPSLRRAARRASLVSFVLATALNPLAAMPAAASHVSAVDITATACTSEMPRGRFDDVPADSTFAPAIDCVAWYGVTTGSGPATYDPSANVTRAQMAMFIQRMAETLGAELDRSDAGFSDLGAVSPAAREAINALANAGVVTGTSSSPKTYSPAAPVTRAQMAAYLNRLRTAFYGRPFPATVDAFDDTLGTPLRADINALAGEGIVTGTGQDRTYNPGGLVTRAQMAGFLARYLEVDLANEDAHITYDLGWPSTLSRGSLHSFNVAITNAEAREVPRAKMTWRIDSEIGVLPHEVSIQFLDPYGRWVNVPWREVTPGQRGTLVASWTGSEPPYGQFSIPADGTTLPVRFGVHRDAPMAGLTLSTELASTYPGEGVLAARQDHYELKTLN